MEYDSTLLVRLLPPVPAAFLAGTFAAFFPTAGVLAIFDWCWLLAEKLWAVAVFEILSNMKISQLFVLHLTFQFFPKGAFQNKSNLTIKVIFYTYFLSKYLFSVFLPL